MLLEEFSCGPTPIPRRSSRRSNTAAVVVVQPDASSPGYNAVQVYLPNDEYREKRCRAIIEEWRIVAATHQ